MRRRNNLIFEKEKKKIIIYPESLTIFYHGGGKRVNFRSSLSGEVGSSNNAPTSSIFVMLEARASHTCRENG